MHHVYKTKGTCSSEIRFDMESGVVHNIEFIGGCNGNLKAIGRILDGAKAEEVVGKLQGLTCGFRKTSCSDQLATAISMAVKKEAGAESN